MSGTGEMAQPGGADQPDETAQPQDKDLQEPGAAPPGGSDAGEGVELTAALEETLSSLTQSIDRMETIVRRLEEGGTDWEESVRLLTEANELAMKSSQRLEQAVQDVVYGAEDEEEAAPPVGRPD